MPAHEDDEYRRLEALDRALKSFELGAPPKSTADILDRTKEFEKYLMGEEETKEDLNA